MSKILIVNSSPRGERSLSRKLSTAFAKQWTEQYPDDVVISRDLASHPVPPVTEAWIVGAFAPVEARSPEANAAIAISDELVDELLSADRYIFGVPMYNLNIPSTFKAYIDQIVRVGRTFSVGANGYEGLVKGKKALFVTASGGSYQPESPYAPYNFQEPYLRTIAGFIGITDVQFVSADSQNLGETEAKHALAKAEDTLNGLLKSW
jgi:FMN-dependent NADH-azoreductase